MPTYEYKCPKCGTRFEKFQRITAKPGAPCPKCGATAERLISGGHGTAAEKIKALEGAGIAVAKSPALIAQTLLDRIGAKV
jgi:putative FmdB family regulatory protein